MITVSEYIISFLSDHGMHDVFLVSGGGIMYLLDALGKNKTMRYIVNSHEQACATAAEGYTRTNNIPGVCFVTTGPGSTNAITGVAGAWYDSIPILVISGQVRTEVIADYTKSRQNAPQEVNIIPMVTPITKYAVTIMDPTKIRYELEKAYSLAISGRPGPVWINIPLDVQNTFIDETKLRSFSPKKQLIPSVDKNSLDALVGLLENSKRPLLILGNGVRLSTEEKVIEQFVKELGIPVGLVLNGMDLIGEDNPLFIGRVGPAGQRRANFALQNADFILSVGASLNINSTGFNTKGFAPKAKKVVVNIEKGEIDKLPFLIDLKIESDARVFIEEVLKRKKDLKINPDSRWIPACLRWKEEYPPVLPEFKKGKKYVNSYAFFDELCTQITDRATVVTGMGQDVVSFIQVFRVQKGQKAFVNKNFGQMGWCLPAAIGACIGSGRKHVILVTGDGSIQFNLHELETISFNKLPITIFVFNNNGYKSIRDTQNNLFQGRLVGADPTSGLGNPDFKWLAKGFHLQYRYIKNHSALKRVLPEILTYKGPILCELNIDPNQERVPRPGTFINKEGKLESTSLENLYPPLPKEEIDRIMHMFD